ncbi:MAG TPA: sulfurtransferase [Isosphaeraceae bacterium]|nr:sulfurtransferase [Isosphaeraceae bacterium]
MIRIAAVVLSAMVLAGAPARGDSPALLVSFDELQGRLDDPNLRLLDARPRADYERAHIPGAVRVDAKAAEALASRPGGLTDRGAWQAWVAPLGIGPKTEVLIYDGDRQLDPARLWGLLRYLGVERVGLIDGNFPLWQKEDRPVATDVPSVAPQPFAVTLRSGRYATRGDVLAAIEQGKARIIDARSEAEYSGEKKLSRRGGHIPAACRLEWSDLVDKDGRFLDEKALRAKLDTLGVEPGEPVITHCQGGGRASVDAFALERLGFPTRNYYVGWSDWGNAEDTPVTTGKEPSARP